MRSLLIVCALVFYLDSNVTKAQTLERQVIASLGSTATGDFTIGEVIVNISNLLVTAGFQQGEMTVEDPPLSVEDITQKLSVFPVPTKDVLTVQGIALSPENTVVTIYSLQGRKMEVAVDTGVDQLTLDLTNLPSGNYFLRLSDTVNQKIANYKILKIK